MSGRENKNFIIRLQRANSRRTVYHIIVSRVRTDGRSRKASLGSLVMINENLAYLKIDLTQLSYFLYKKISFSRAFAKIIGLENHAYHANIKPLHAKNNS
jgi:hypothetical protein